MIERKFELLENYIFFNFYNNFDANFNYVKKEPLFIV